MLPRFVRLLWVPFSTLVYGWQVLHVISVWQNDVQDVATDQTVAMVKCLIKLVTVRSKRV